jgi:hypothetical protein
MIVSRCYPYAGRWHPDQSIRTRRATPEKKKTGKGLAIQAIAVTGKP